ncbi:hypothetical protein [Mucilaginibacter ginsenosidivorax]|uniref:Uncharacterized protein n=1 Tax=Mucilaginibacter ginsenosidivorax TaxID=862126 RepID=A0A5B8VWK1_9SPHI|nr:hypothetical protein [Mucilaginibacter ginsenosidivorax]QEC75673.1 hypothetical protein FSB76_06815 [Mucilaginibacter ginsenosidivorax]
MLPVSEFYVAGVVDERDDRSPVAWLLPATQATAATPRLSLDLQGGVSTAVKQYFDKSVPANKTLRPIIIHIKKIRVDEKLQPDGRVEGKAGIILSFWLKKDGEDIHLVDYRGGTGYTRSTGQQMDIGGLLSNSLQAGLAYFSTWINKQADSNIKLAKGVKLIFSDYTEKPEGDTIYYSAKRPLKWDDFQQKPPASKYEAEVFPSISYGEQAEVVKGIVCVRISLKPYLPKSACWVKNGARTPYSLNHEQRHFDIVKLVMEHFKQHLLKEKLTVDNYDGPINMQYLDSFREMNDMEKRYDDETNHGMNESVQEEWNKKIDRELSFSIK